MYSSRMQNSRIRYLTIFFDTAPIDVFTYTGCNEQVDGHRRCDHTDRSIYNNDKTKCDRAYTKCSSDRQQDRCYQKDDGLCLKEASQNRSSRFITNRMTNLLVKIAMIVVDKIVRNILSGHEPAKRCRHGYDEQYNWQSLRRNQRRSCTVSSGSPLNTNTEMISA